MHRASDQKLTEVCCLQNQKEFIKDLKLVYKAISKEAAEDEHDRLEEK